MNRDTLHAVMEANRANIVDWDGRIDDLIDAIDKVTEGNGIPGIADKTALKIEIQLLIEAWLGVEEAERVEVDGQV